MCISGFDFPDCMEEGERGGEVLWPSDSYGSFPCLLLEHYKANATPFKKSQLQTELLTTVEAIAKALCWSAAVAQK